MTRPLPLAAVLAALTLAAPAAAQGLLAGNRTDCAVTAGGDIAESEIKVICGIPPDKVVAMMQLVASPVAADRDRAVQMIAVLLPEDARLQATAVASFLTTLGEKNVPPERLNDSLAEIAGRFLELQDQVFAFRADDPKVQALTDRAASTLAAASPDLDAADCDLKAARALMRTKREALQQAAADAQREEAAIARQQALVAASRLDRVAAADLYLQAADLLPPTDTEVRWSDTLTAANLLTNQGEERGDNAALVRAIDLYREALSQVSRSEVPSDWATTQMNLGTALQTLGARESGTARLEEAVAAYRAALEERTRERVPLDWARTQMNLGNALQTLGLRDLGPARLEQAVAAYRAVLQEMTRERVPLDWAMTQNNLGTALAALGERESSTASLEEAGARLTGR